MKIAGLHINISRGKKKNPMVRLAFTYETGKGEEQVKEMNMIKDSSRDTLNYMLSLKAVAGRQQTQT